MEKLKICFSFFVLLLVMVGLSKALTCSIKSSCSANELCIFSTYQINDTHAGNCSAYANKYCCSNPFLTSASVKEFCGIGEFSILAFYNYTDAHAETFNNSVLELRFEENSSNLVFDSSGKGNHGEIYGASWSVGRFGAALNFTSNAYVVVPDSDTLDLTDAFTIMAWIYPRGWGQGNYGRIIDKNSTSAYNFFISNDSSNIQNLRAILGGTSYQTPNYTVFLNSWQHVVITFDKNLPSSQIKFYINGTLVATATRTTSVPNNTEPLYIGNRNTLDRAFNGTIDEVRIYNRALTEEEIKSLYYRYRLCVSCPWSCEVKPSCSAGEFNITSVFNLTNTHLAEPAYYNLKLCCKREDFVPSPLSQAQNNSNPNVGEAVLLSVYWKDNGNLSYAILETNETGTWQNKTTYGSPLFLNHFMRWSNFTWQNSSVPPVTTVGWRVYVNDSCGNWNVSNTFTFKTREPNPPRYSLNSTNSTVAGTAVSHNLFWQDDVGLSGYIFSFDNCTGTLVNDSFHFFGEVNEESLSDRGGLIGLWHFNEGSGTVTKDSVNHLYNGTINYGTWVDGRFGKALQFNGTDGCVVIPSSFPTLQTNKTILGWVNRNPNSRATIFTVDDADWGYRGYGLSIDTVGRLIFRVGNGTHGESKVSSISVSPNVWTFVAAVYDNSTNSVTFFVNGTKDGPYGFSLPNTWNISQFSPRIGGEDCTGNEVGLNGSIDEVQVYNRSLSEGEIKSLYERANSTHSWSNVTKLINSTVGCTIRWCVYANDTSNNWNGTSCLNPFSYVTIPYILSAELSPKLSEGIFFTNKTGAEINQQFPIHIDWNNATWNYNSSSKKTEYWINNTGTVPIDICLKANDHLTCSSGSCAGLTIDINNVAWNNSTSNDAGNPNFDTSKRLSLSYQKVAFNVAPSQLIYFRFWANVPFGQPSGIYNTTFKAKAVEVGTSC